MMDARQRAALDRHITGNYGEDQFPKSRRKRESSPSANVSTPSVNQVVADACRKVAVRLMNQVDAGHVSTVIDANTLYETLHALAQEIESAMADLTFQMVVDRGGFSTSKTLEAIQNTGIKGRLVREQAIDRNTGRTYPGPETRYWTLAEAQRIWEYLRQTTGTRTDGPDDFDDLP